MEGNKCNVELDLEQMPLNPLDPFSRTVPVTSVIYIRHQRRDRSTGGHRQPWATEEHQAYRTYPHLTPYFQRHVQLTSQIPSHPKYKNS